MKKLSVLFALLSFVIFGNAQTSGGPDAFGYTWKNSLHTVSPPVYSWYDISVKGTLVVGLADDNVVGPFALTNGFRYYWYSPTQFWIGSNGYLSFNGDNISSPFPSMIPDPAGANNYIACLLSDLNFSGVGNPGKCYYYQTSDTLCVSFVDVPYWYSSAPTYTGQNSFQIILSTVDSSITFNYISTNLGLQTTLDNIGGIENVAGVIGLNPFTDVLPPSNYTIKFYYHQSPSFQSVDGGINWNDNEANGGIFIKKDAAPYPMIANVKNFGNTNLNMFLVKDTVFASNGTVVASGGAVAGPLAPNTDVTVNFSDSLVVTAAGRYTNVTYVTGIPGDIVPSNNKLQQEIVAVDTAAGLMTLEFTDGIANGTGLNWNGGNGGIAVYIEPPTYPVKINSSRFFITANTSGVGFYAVIYDDNGPNGTKGTVLDSVFVPPSGITINSYKTVSHLSKSIILNSGGVYLLWYMGGTGIALGRDTDPPISRRMIEVLGTGWAGYRDLLTEDFMLGLVVDYPWPRADFKAIMVQDPKINFRDLSSNDPTTWYWTFGDGDTSTTKDPIHDYIENGKYEVCLAVSNSYGSDTICDTIEIKKVIPTAYFTYNDSALPKISFRDESIGPPTSWQWNLADTVGPNVFIQNVTYTYKNNGIHNVCLTATNVNGSSAPYCEDINIYGIGLAEYILKELQIHPNPITDEAVITLPSTYNSEELSLITMNMLGAEVEMDYHIEKTQISLSREGLTNGTYIVQIMERGRPVAFAKVVVE